MKQSPVSLTGRLRAYAHTNTPEIQWQAEEWYRIVNPNAHHYSWVYQYQIGVTLPADHPEVYGEVTDIVAKFTRKNPTVPILFRVKWYYSLDEAWGLWRVPELVIENASLTQIVSELFKEDMFGLWRSAYLSVMGIVEAPIPLEEPICLLPDLPFGEISAGNVSFVSQFKEEVSAYFERVLAVQARVFASSEHHS